jgi:hypothetical protein
MTENVITRPWPTSERRTPHIFGDDTRIPADKSPSGKTQKDRTCAVCGVVIVTVFGEGGTAWREWRLSASGPQQQLQEAPACKTADNLA